MRGLVIAVVLLCSACDGPMVSMQKREAKQRVKHRQNLERLKPMSEQERDQWAEVLSACLTKGFHGDLGCMMIADRAIFSLRRAM